MTLKLITGPATEPVTLAEARLQCRVDADITTDDALLTALIVAVREQAEHEIGRPLITQTWEKVLDEFPAAELEIGKPNLLSITSLKYIDVNGVEQTMDPSLYYVDTDSTSGWVLPAADTEWPDTDETVNAVRVRFTCGYGAASDVPEGIKAWIKLRVATLYKFREHIAAGASVNELPSGFVDRILDPYRAWGV